MSDEERQGRELPQANLGTQKCVAFSPWVRLSGSGTTGNAVAVPKPKFPRKRKEIQWL
jgi:hypothetical protein